MSWFRHLIRRVGSIGAAALLTLCFVPAAWAQDAAGQPARQQPIAGQQKAGISKFPNGALAYRPAKAPPGPLPLLVLFHGSTGNSRQFLEWFRGVADRRGLQLLSLQSKGYTWDVINRRKLAADGDVTRVASTLQEYLRVAAVDPRRIVLTGFSDGASYALALGLSSPQLFSSVIALSPGLFILPEPTDRSQRVFIAHGKSDPILPFQKTAKVAVDLGSSVDLRFRPFDGDHEIDRKALSEGLDFALDGKP